MDATDVIAGYAAVVASTALAWEVWRQRQSRRLRLKVQFIAWQGKDGWVLRITVINLSDFGVRIRNVRVRGVHVQKDSSRTASLWAKLSYTEVRGTDLPGEVPARDSREVQVLFESLKDSKADPAKPLSVEVTTATGETVIEGPYLAW
jgi:hypothetical protein